MALIGCEALSPIFATVLRDWRMEKLDAPPGSEIVITLEKTAERYERRSIWQPDPVGFRAPVDAVCDFIVDLIHAYVAEHQELLCLHCAAVELKTGLMVFPNTYRVGKSLLSTKLVSLGARLFSDDVLPVLDQGPLGSALGILPRLRRPLPQTVGHALTSFINQRIGPQSARYHYVRLDTGELARRGSVSPVSVITVLKRRPQARPALQPARKSDVVRDMILRNFARQSPAIEIVDRLHALVAQAQCFTLTYDTLDQAAEIIEDAFGIRPAEQTA